MLPHDQNIIKKVMAVKKVKYYGFKKAIKDKKVKILGKKVDDAYIKTVSALTLGNYRDVYVVFTPLNGCASTSFLPVLKKVGFKKIETVKKQMPFLAGFGKVNCLMILNRFSLKVAGKFFPVTFYNLFRLELRKYVPQHRFQPVTDGFFPGFVQVNESSLCIAFPNKDP